MDLQRDADTDLCTLHARLHAAVIGDYLVFAATLTTLDLAAAGADWRYFRARFDAHAHAEENVVFPACAGLALPPKSDLAMLARDHALLRQTIDDIDALMVELDAVDVDSRRALLVRHLDPLVRMHRTLEHHGEREDHLFYPRAQAELDAPTRERLVIALQLSGA